MKNYLMSACYAESSAFPHLREAEPAHVPHAMPTGFQEDHLGNFIDVSVHMGDSLNYPPLPRERQATESWSGRVPSMLCAEVGADRHTHRVAVVFAMDQMCARQEIQSFWVQHNTSLWESKGIPSARS